MDNDLLDIPKIHVILLFFKKNHVMSTADLLSQFSTLSFAAPQDRNVESNPCLFCLVLHACGSVGLFLHRVSSCLHYTNTLFIF